MNIDVGIRSKQLPTFVMFYDGEEQRRLPYFDRADAKKVVATRFTRPSLQSFFFLDLSSKDALKKLGRAKDARERAGGAKED